ncbi:polysaccharide deacetylase family protein [Flavobacterium muglaense]|uniref:Polysaccharide deacetylase family protein n=1 Tax=Flavobacterium muglaense TaxID=2764716 RepID=A0A923SEZ5_9FLAO|nr:polysaccharide deacetylase family protein [Flavobacterium muglaense]MBC5837343.1 polysaccharide deacetylase family protein [Flavobacterium muglaense]MBC5843925.1 polysaccharide deacetylase family protein [Flavobacterium muglaense]
MLKHKAVAIFFTTILAILAIASLFVAIEIGYAVIVIFVWFIVVLYGSTFIFSNYHVHAYCSNPLETEKKIAITFDDGPSPNTTLILEVLEKYQVKAAFFCIGQQVEKHPEIVRKLISENHIIANHSYEHSSFFDFLRRDSVIEELRKTDALIEKYLGKKPQFFRPPYGVTNPSIRRALEVTKHKVIGWNIRSLDGIIKNEKFIYKRIIKRVKPGAIILMHDTTFETVQVLEQLLLFLEKNKYEVVPIDQLLNLKAYEN